MQPLAVKKKSLSWNSEQLIVFDVVNSYSYHTVNFGCFRILTACGQMQLKFSFYSFSLACEHDTYCVDM